MFTLQRLMPKMVRRPMLTMGRYDSQAHKLSPGIEDRNPRVVARVTLCLTDPDHRGCTGYYVDESGHYFVKCECNCHFSRS